MSHTARTKKYFRGSPPRFHSRSAKMHLLRQNSNCAICGKPIENLKDATIDHVIPISKGGQDNLQNMRVAHAECNFKKGASANPK